MEQRRGEKVGKGSPAQSSVARMNPLWGFEPSGSLRAPAAQSALLSCSLGAATQHKDRSTVEEGGLGTGLSTGTELTRGIDLEQSLSL